MASRLPMTHPGEKLPAIMSQPPPEQGMAVWVLQAGGWMGAGCSHAGGTAAVSALAAAGGQLTPWAKWEGGRKGKELQMGRIAGSAYLPCGVSPRKGRARRRQTLTASSPGAGGSQPPTPPPIHTTGSQFAAGEGCEPQTGTQGVPQCLAELKPILFSRTAPENQPRTTTVLVKQIDHHQRHRQSTQPGSPWLWRPKGSPPCPARWDCSLARGTSSYS